METKTLSGTKLYHFQVGIPKELVYKFGIFNLVYSQHAMEQAKQDRYGFVRLPQTLDTNTAKVIEIETDMNDKVTKVVYRVPYSRENDLVLVVMPDRQFVKTVWLNRKNDLHRTLDRAKYTQVRKIA